MNELKPVASYFESPGNADECVPTIRKIDFGVRGGKWKPLHYIPDTHRVVSVELLETIKEGLNAAWTHDEAVQEIRTIINNKGEA